jgi:hypothetical protein
MSKQIIRYFFIFIAIAALLLILLRGRMPFGKSNSSFAVSPEVKITRIDFYQGNNKLSIEKSGELWLINKKYEARKSAVLFTLNMLREIKIKSPVSAEIFTNEVVNKKLDPVKVNIFEKRRLVKSFFVYKTASNVYGNIMKIKASSKPFIVYIPGYEENIGIHFIVNELFWQPFMVFNLSPSQITSVKLENLVDTSSSFLINCDRKGYMLSDLNRNITGWDTLKVQRYLSYYTAIPFEKWAFGLPESEKKSIESVYPIYRITVNQSDGNEIILTVWEKWNIIDGVKKTDTDRIWAKTNSRDEIFVMRYFDLDPVLKKRSYFITH